MILGFMKRFPDGNLTQFVSKIMESLDPFPIQPPVPKHHTIRTDSKKRWKAGVKIHFCTGVRTKQMNNFAMGVCNLVQEVEMYFHSDSTFNIIIDDKVLEDNEIKLLAINDGFDNVHDFIDYFKIESNAKNDDSFIKKRLIHWTDLKY